MSSPIYCPNCSSQIAFREWSKRKPAKSEALGDCPNCGKVQVRFWHGRQTSEPYQVKAKAQKTRRGSWRLSPEREAAIIAVCGSVQDFLDNHPLVCMSLLVKQ